MGRCRCAWDSATYSDLRKTAAEALVKSRIEEGLFRSAEDLAKRFPPLTEQELKALAKVGALNEIDGIEHRRDALWQVERAGKPEGPLFGQRSEWLREESDLHPLSMMTTEERLVADYAGTGLTTGKHPMYYRRGELREQGVLSAEELQKCKDGEFMRTAGCVITRQRPGTAKGVIFMTLGDETNISNVIVMPDLYDRNRLLVTRSKFLLVEGVLQNRDNVVHVKATRLMTLSDRTLELSSHDFH